MNIRRLVKSGTASHTISLPKDWINKNKLKKGDLLYINEKNNELTISSETKELPIAQKEISIEVEENPFTIRLGKIEIGTPRVMEVDGSERRVYPAEARIRNLTYAAPLNLEMTPIIGEKEGEVRKLGF